MKSKLIKNLFFFLALAFYQVSMSQTQWTWVSGSTSSNITRNYGVAGVPGNGATPGSRIGAASWTDLQGNFWMFGGEGNSGSDNGVLNDLWRYNTTTNEWTWVTGSKDLNGAGYFVSKSTASPLNVPGGRHNGVSWTDNSGNFWLFGGFGIPSSSGDDDDVDFPEQKVMLNDLWKFSPVDGQWTFVSGTENANQHGIYGERQEASAAFRPGGRYSASAWKDGSGKLWLFGGRGYASNDQVGLLDDVWRYDPINNSWAWMAGDKDGNAAARHGQQGAFGDENTPGGRLGSFSWTDNNGTFWLYGGGTLTDLFGDLWKFDHTEQRWAWMSGSITRNRTPQPGSPGVPADHVHPGARTLSAVWVDPANDVWVFGGNGHGGITGSSPLNDLWKYTTASNTWTFIRGDLTNPTAVYGTKGETNDVNQPGGTGNASFWQDGAGQFWLYGGRSSGTDYLDQVWKLSIACAEEITGTITPANANICKGDSIQLTVTGGTSYEWRRNDTIVTGQTGATITVKDAGRYSAVIINGSCKRKASNTTDITLTFTNGVRYADISATENEPFTLTARNAGTQFQWSPSTGLENAIAAVTRAVVNKDQLYLVEITTAEGCLIVDTQMVKVTAAPVNNAPDKIVVPTAFTPNGNGVNDLLRPLRLTGQLEYFRVFNRWGTLLFQTNLTGSGWDGNYNGVQQPADTYTWVLVTRASDGSQIKQSGKAILVR